MPLMPLLFGQGHNKKNPYVNRNKDWFGNFSCTKYSQSETQNSR